MQEEKLDDPDTAFLHFNVKSHSAEVVEATIDEPEDDIDLDDIEEE